MAPYEKTRPNQTEAKDRHRPTRVEQNGLAAPCQIWSVKHVSICHFLTEKPPENAPTVVHIYEFPYTLSKEINLDLTNVPRLRSLLIQQQPVVQASWNPVRKGVLSLCTGASSLYTWSDEWIGEDGEEEMAECIGIPIGGFQLYSPVVSNVVDLPSLPTAQFEDRVIRWSPDGKGVALLGRDTFCCAFEVTDSEMPDDE